MAYITNMTFEHVGKDEGVLCDRCGQYIRNIYTVYYSDGYVMHCGVECFKKLRESGRLSDYGMKVLMKIAKKIKQYSEELAMWKTLTEEEAEEKKLLYPLHYYEAWQGKTFEEYKEWNINKWYPARFAECEKELAKFNKIDFNI